MKAYLLLSDSFQRGSALIAVFWIMAVMGVAIVASMRVVSYQMNVVGSQIGGVEALQYAERGIAIAVNPVIHKSDPLLQQTFEDGDGFRAKITSEGARFNINAILSDSQPDKALMRLILVHWGIDIDTAADITDALRDWVDSDDNSEINGAEYSYYEHQGFTKYPFNRRFYSLDEMRLVRGMDIVESYQPNWRDWFTVWSSGKLDVLEARAELIAVATQSEMEDAQRVVDFATGPDRIRGTEDDETQIGFQEILDFLEVIDVDGTLSRRITGDIPAIERIESTGFVGDTQRTIVMVVEGRTQRNPQILDRREKVNE